MTSELARPIVSRLPEGFAAAVCPVTAATITTDAVGLIAGEVEIPTGDVRIPAYRALPAAGTSFPTILVIQEIFGIHEHIKDLCRRLAKTGYLAVAPYLYAREGDVSGLTEIPEIYAKVVSHVPDAQVMSDLDATVAWASKNGGDTKRLVATGFCWGGRAVWLYAAHSSALKAGAAWYGRLIGTPTAKQPKNPVDVASELKAPVIGLYGGKDAGISLDSVEQMRMALKANKPSEIHVYSEAQHGFNADYRPSYDPEAAKDAWAKMLSFFQAKAEISHTAGTRVP
ncbi:MAG TPA: dienelactone hydrolase family protein [Bryobacteraceae bacterium]|jgi:carboxymethylenebutenolidase|nr:dienelactone hydrolase family protein [Bryobacteraceae bacterium]